MRRHIINVHGARADGDVVRWRTGGIADRVWTPRRGVPTSDNGLWEGTALRNVTNVARHEQESGRPMASTVRSKTNQTGIRPSWSPTGPTAPEPSEPSQVTHAHSTYSPHRTYSTRA